MKVGAPARVGLVAPNDDVIGPAKVGDLSEDDLVDKFGAGVSMVTSLSLALSYPTLAAAPHTFINAYKNVQAVAVATRTLTLKLRKRRSVLRTQHSLPLLLLPRKIRRKENQRKSPRTTMGSDGSIRVFIAISEGVDELFLVSQGLMITKTFC